MLLRATFTGELQSYKNGWDQRTPLLWMTSCLMIKLTQYFNSNNTSKFIWKYKWESCIQNMICKYTSIIRRNVLRTKSKNTFSAVNFLLWGIHYYTWNYSIVINDAFMYQLHFTVVLNREKDAFLCSLLFQICTLLPDTVSELNQALKTLNGKNNTFIH